MRQIPIVLLSIDFLSEFVTKAKQDHLETTSKVSKSIQHIKYLLENYIVELDLSKESIRKIFELKIEDKNSFIALANELNLPFNTIQYLFKIMKQSSGNKIISKIEKLAQLINIEAIEILPNCAMLKCDNKIKKTIETSYGIVCYIQYYGTFLI